MKHMRNVTISGFILLSCMINLYAEGISGKSLSLYGDSAASIGRGATGVTVQGIDHFYINPASLAGIERVSLGIQYGTLDGSYYNPHLSLAVPTSYGVVGGSLRMFHLKDAEDLKNGYQVMLGGAKMMTPRMALGMSLNMFYGEAGEDAYYIGASLGAYYRFSSTRKRNGFGLTNPKIGGSINFGGPFGPDAEYAQFNSMTLGYSFTFFSHAHASITFLNELSCINLYRDFPVKFGLETEILKYIIIRLGFIVPQSYDFGVFTCGAGFNLITDNFVGTLNYAFNLNRDNSSIHYIGLNMEMGALDTRPPETEVLANEKFISPNHDGIQDFVIFSLDVEDESRINGWQLQVKNTDDTVIKEYRMSERDVIQGLTFKTFFKRIFQKKVSFVVPEKIMWDGTDDTGRTVPDGKYTYTFHAWDERDNIAAKKEGVVIIDNTIPEITLSAKENLFSPNGDKQKDRMYIRQVYRSEPGDEWDAGFKDESGTVVRKYQWNGSSIPRTVVWDGTDDSGKNVPEGLYSYFIGTTDNAGNSASAVISQISLTREYESADVIISRSFFSYLSDSEIKLFLRLSRRRGLVNWNVDIFNSRGSVKKNFNGESDLPPFILWDGKDNDEKTLDDGEYRIKFSTVFNSGNTPSSFEKKLVIDSTPPEASIKHVPVYFSPDGDGENDILYIKANGTDNRGIRNWIIRIYAPSGDVFKVFSGSDAVPEEVIWDGLGEDLDIVESAADYYLELEVTDLAGNTTVSKKDTVQVDILVIVTERGLKMRISNIEFSFGSADLLEKGRKILDRVAEILRKYENYDVVIEGHTDDIGEEDYNLSLSEERAKAVQDYLIKRRIKEDRLQFIGMGETVPLYPNTGMENRRRNRRVEFLLIKKGE